MSDYSSAKDKYYIKHINVDIDSNILRINGNDLASAEQSLLEQAEEDAANIIKNAEEAAADIIAKAKIEAEKIIQQTKKSAYDEGYEQGINEAAEKAEDKINQAQSLLNEMVHEKYKLISDLEPQIIQLCMNIAEKIIGQEIEIDNSKFLSIIQNAINKASASENIEVYVSPKQFGNVSKLKNLLLSECNNIKNIDIFEKELTDELGCLIVTECGEIDAGVISQI